MLNKEILFSPFPKQEEFLSCALSGEYDFVLFGGAIRGGKTFALLGLFILLSKVYPGSRWAIVRKDLQVIRRNTYPSWEKIKPEAFVKRHDKELHIVTFKNGSEIIFFAENYDKDKELNRWKGLEVNGIGFEEINECQEDSLYKAFERAGAYIIKGAKKQPKPIVVGTCNPSRSWVKSLIYDKYKDGTLRSRWRYIQSRIYDNEPLLKEQPTLIQGYKDNMPRYQFEMFVNGDWELNEKTGGEAYKTFDLDKHVGECKYDENKPLHISFDENVNPYLPAGVFQIDGTKIYWLKEILGINPYNTVKDVCSMISKEYSGHNAGMFIYGDATSQKSDTKIERGYNFFTLIIEYLKEFKPQLRLMTANPSVVMRLQWINTWFEKETGGITITIDESCKTAINDFLYVKESPDGTKNKQMTTNPKTKVRYQEYGHLSDLFDYFVCTAFLNEYNKFQSGGSSNIRAGSRRISRRSY